MASIRKRPNTRFYTACFTDSNGEQRQRSTKTTSRAQALLIAARWERAYENQMTEAQARRIVSDIHEDLHGRQLANETVKTYAAKWLKAKEGEIGRSSFERYKGIMKLFLEQIGQVGDRDIAQIGKDEMVTFRAYVAQTRSPKTANVYVKVLRHFFHHSVNDGLRLDNPAKRLESLKIERVPGATERRPFRDEELKALLVVLEGEWLGLVLFGYFTGQRLGDIACLYWSALDLARRTWTIAGTEKTNRPMRIPLAEPLIKHLLKLPKRSFRDPVFPHASQAKFDAHGNSRRLSNQFHDLLVRAGLAKKRSKANTGRGHGTARKVSELSFHSLRHNATTAMKAAGVPEAVVRDLIGHESEIVSREYTQLDDSVKMAAIGKLGDIATPQ
jgi:integrase